MRRVAFFSGLLALASASVAQVVGNEINGQSGRAAAGQTVTLPFEKKLGSKSNPISTYKFVPKVKPVTNLIKREVQNKTDHPVPSIGEPNTMQFGQLSDLPNPAKSLALFPGINATGWNPPDPDIGVSPTHVVEVVNVAVAFFRRDGTKIFEQDLGQTGFFQGVATAGFVFDPKAFYDPISQRFFIVALEQDGAAQISGLLIAVSDDSNPEGNWHRYRVDAKQTVGADSFWLDYPGFGFSNDAVMITGNMFGFNGGFNGIQFIVLNKSALINGTPPTISRFTQSGGSVQVMRIANEPAATVLYGMNFANTSNARVHAVVGGGGPNPTLQSVDVAVPTWAGPAQGGNSVGGNQLDSLDGRIFNVAYRNGKMWATHGIRASQNDPRNVARWYELNLRNWPTSPNPPIYVQGGNVGQPGQDFILPAICANAIGEVAIVMTRCSPSIVADFVIAARRANDTAGTMRAPVRLATSIGSSYGGPSNRWGDYFGLQADPVDDRTFWGVGMVANASGGWQTVINSFRLTVPFTAAATAVAKYEGGATSGTVTAIQTSNNVAYTIASVPVLRTGEVASAIVDFTLPSATQELNVSVESRAIVGVTGSLHFWDWTKSAWVFAGSTPLTATDSIKTYSAGMNYSKYTNAQNKVRVLVRAIYPTQVGRVPLKHTFRIDHVSAAGSN